MSQEQSVNQFTELNTDSHPINTKPNVMTDAINAALTTKGKNQLILQNMNGNEHVTQLTEGFQPLGVEVFKGISYIVSGRFDSNGNFIEGEIGSFPSPDWDNLVNNGIDASYYLPMKDKYAPLKNFSTIPNNSPVIPHPLDDDVNYNEPFRTPELNFLSDRLIEVEIQPSYDDSVNIIFTDDYNPVRLINSRFKVSEDGKNAAIADRRQDKDTNTYAEARFGATKLLRQSDTIVDLTYNGLSYGGAIKGGGYRFYFKYTDSDGGLTDIIEESRLISMGYDDHGATDQEDTGKTISFTLNNLDQKFSGIKVYYSHAVGETDTTTTIYEIQDIYDLPATGGSMNITVYGTEVTDVISYATLNIDYSSIDTVKTIAQHDDRLVLGNITNTTDNFDIFSDAAQGLHIEEITKDITIKEKGEGYADPSNVYYNLGYWSGETYEVGIIFILNNGRGLTPALPIRGGDNYDGTFSYTGTSPITSADGFVGNTSENRLGVYRTHKRKVLLKGAAYDTTEVKGLRVNVQSLINNSIIQSETDGFFFVRKERKNDALVQGYMCNTAEIPTLLSPTTPTYKSVQDCRWGIGKDRYGSNNHGQPAFEDNVKVMPSPGRIWENIIMYQDTPIVTNNNVPGIKRGDPLSMQGIVWPDPTYYSHNGKAVPMSYAFYTPDALVNKPYMSSIFNGSNKGLAINGVNGNTVIGRQDVVENLQVTTTPGGGTGYPIQWQGEFPIPSNQTINSHICTTGTATTGNLTCGTNPPANGDLTILGPWGGGFETAPNSNITLNLDAEFRSLDGAWSIGPVTHTYVDLLNISHTRTETGFLKIDLQIDSSGNYVPGSGTVGGYALDATYSTGTSAWTAFRYLEVFDSSPKKPSVYGNQFAQSPQHDREIGVVNSAVFSVPLNTMSVGQTGTFTIQVKLPIYRYYKYYGNSEGNTPTLAYTETVEVTGTYTLTGMQNTINNNLHTVSSTDNTPIQDIRIENIVFDPTPLDDLDTGESIKVNYIPDNQDSFSNGQFASKSDRNLFYTARDAQDNNLIDQPYSSNPNSEQALSGVNTGIIWAADQIRFADYIGVKISKIEQNDKADIYLANELRNDDQSVRNYLAFQQNGYGLAGTDIADWTYKVQHEGFRLGVVSNIYSSPIGPQTQTDWKNKYNNSGVVEPYYAISKRYSWEDVINNADIDIYDGDCFINYAYKRLNYSLGIEGTPSATDPTLYAYLLQPGLYDRGTVFPIVCESNYNTSMRTFEFFSPEEKVLYGKNRTYFPIDTIEDIRGSRQNESAGYNHGYHYAFSDRNYTALNDRSPVLNINYGNRVMVSESAVAGNFKNGYTDFSGLNFRDYNKQLGEITKLVAHNNHLFCIFEKGTGVVPMNQRTMVGGEGDGVFIDDAKILAQKMKIISTEYGSDQQFSIIKTDEYIYGCDLNKTKIWRIVSQGEQHSMELISDFAVQVILNEYKDRLDNNRLPSFVKANYDRERNNVIFSFLNQLDGKYTTDLYQMVAVPPNDPDPIGDVPVEVGDVGGDTPVDPPVDDEFTDIDLSGPVNAADFAAYETAKKTKAASDTPVTDASAGTATDDAVDGLDTLSPNSKGEVILPGGYTTIPGYNEQLQIYEPVLVETNKLGSLYFNETISKWVSRLSWNPLFTFNISNDLYSFNAVDNMDKVWEHFSPNVPYCHFYGNQDKFEFEFVLVDNSSAQKILNNLHFICNRTFPGRITYKIDSDVDYETFAVTDGSYTQLMKQRHEYISWTATQFMNGGNLLIDFGISAEEAERIVGSHFVHNNIFYIIGNAITLNGVNYVGITDEFGAPVTAPLTGLNINRLEFGIIKQNMEYREDHLYVEVGKGTDKSRVRDKAIKIRIVYEGNDYVTIQSIISKFVYSFN